MSRSPPNAPPTPPLGPFTRRSRHRRPRSPLHPPEISHSQGRRREVPRRAGHPPFAGDVVLGLWVAAQAGDGDAVNGRVDLAVAAAVEVVAVGLARARIAATPAARPSLAARGDLPAPAISRTSLAPANGLKPGSHSSCGVAVSPDARWPPRRRRRRRKPARSEPQPVHALLLIHHGVYLLESLDLERSTPPACASSCSSRCRSRSAARQGPWSTRRGHLRQALAIRVDPRGVDRVQPRVGARIRPPRPAPSW